MRAKSVNLLSEPIMANLGGTTEAVFRPIGLKAAIFLLSTL